MIPQLVPGRAQLPKELAIKVLHDVVVPERDGLLVYACQQALGFIEVDEHLTKGLEMTDVVNRRAFAIGHLDLMVMAALRSAAS